LVKEENNTMIEITNAATWKNQLIPLSFSNLFLKKLLTKLR